MLLPLVSIHLPAGIIASDTSVPTRAEGIAAHVSNVKQEINSIKDVSRLKQKI
jgi:hypothetical protein